MRGSLGESLMKADNYLDKIILGLAVTCLTVAALVSGVAADPGIQIGFDEKGEKIFSRFDETPLAAMTGTDGTRNLNSFYELRQYPGSPPRIPHIIDPSFGKSPAECLACHGRGGYNATLDAFIPVTPHPENENCYQCHLPQHAETLFVGTNWQSINPPAMGRSQLPGSPPPIPHNLQLREDCIACHTGPAAVSEIRVEHGSRGNCRQCHLPMPATGPTIEFSRK